jgi:eukaryotic-like serine/threonine-protein kinase
MTPEHWKRVEALFHEATARAPAERAAYLTDACAGDETLRREVASLLDESPSDDGFLAAPALAVAARDVVSETSTGTSLGGYRLEALLGAGGMGEVYRAHDVKLARDVAIKILPAVFTTDPLRLARLEREARILAALNHPNICAIYGFEEAHGVRFLILELVEGETLAQMLSRPAVAGASTGRLTRAQALSVARQLTEALEVAHDKGIVHRDLKPANITVTPDGVVKVLDFGLAKALGGEASSPDLTQAPDDSTGEPRPGAVVGTAAYMSPEQARGLPVDKRTDIWAFGCVVFEMLTGRVAFGGDTVSDSIAKVLEREPDWSALPPDTSPAMRRLLARCLEKDPRERLRDISDARSEIREASTSSSPAAAVHAGRRSSRALPRVVHWIGAGALGAAVTALAAAFGWFDAWRAPPPVAAERLEVGLGDDTLLARTGGASATLSPDGQTLAFVARTATAAQQLYVRALDQLQATPLAGTEGARDPFFSPDGHWIAFFAGGRLKKIATAGGAVATLSEAPDPGGGAWAADGTLVFSPRFITPLVRTPGDGGPAEVITTRIEGELTQRWPQVLPGGRAVLYTSSSSPTNMSNANLVVQALPDGPHTIVQRGATYGRYLATGRSAATREGRDNGHLVFIQGGTMFAAPFDPRRLQAVGPAVSVIEGVTADGSGGGSGVGGAQFAVSDTGTLVYLPGPIVRAVSAPIVWMDRTGRLSPLHDALADWSHLRFSPDGSRLAMDITDAAGNTDVWVYDLLRGDMARATTAAGSDVEPTWTPDGQRLVFQSTREDATTNLYWQRADGTGGVQRLTRSDHHQYGGSSWHPGGRLLAFTDVDPLTGSDLMMLPIGGDERTGWKPATPTVFLRTAANELQPSFSPDGRWLAYVSDESGQFEVYVQPFPGPGVRSKISNGGAYYYSVVAWSKHRHELLFATADRRVMTVLYSVADGSFRADRPGPWGDRPFLRLPRGGTFDLHRDGGRIAIGATPEATAAATADRVVFVFNFFQELQRLAPPAR